MLNQILHDARIGMENQMAVAVVVAVLACIGLCLALAGNHMMQRVQAKWELLVPRAVGLRTNRKAVR